MLSTSYKIVDFMIYICEVATELSFQCLIVNCGFVTNLVLHTAYTFHLMKEDGSY